jgi:hypothetical protein
LFYRGRTPGAFEKERVIIDKERDKTKPKKTKGAVRAKKKEYRCTPTFVNLKSNTMKNTVQRYGLFGSLQIIGHKKDVL